MNAYYRVDDLNSRNVSLITASDGSVYEKNSASSVLLKNLYDSYVVADEERRRGELLERAKMLE